MLYQNFIIIKTIVSYIEKFGWNSQVLWKKCLPSCFESCLNSICVFYLQEDFLSLTSDWYGTHKVCPGSTYVSNIMFCNIVNDRRPIRLRICQPIRTTTGDSQHPLTITVHLTLMMSSAQLVKMSVKCHHKQYISGLHSPEQSYFTNLQCFMYTVDPFDVRLEVSIEIEKLLACSQVIYFFICLS